MQYGPQALCSGAHKHMWGVRVGAPRTCARSHAGALGRTPHDAAPPADQQLPVSDVMHSAALSERMVLIHAWYIENTSITIHSNLHSQHPFTQAAYTTAISRHAEQSL